MRAQRGRFVKHGGVFAFFYRGIEELLDCKMELQQCSQSSNDDDATLLCFDGITTRRREHVQAAPKRSAQRL